MGGKRALYATIDQIGTELGLDVTGGLFRDKRAAGRVEGVEVEVTIGSSADAIGYGRTVEWGRTGPGNYGRSVDRVLRDEPKYALHARTHHPDLGAGLFVVATETPIADRDKARLVLTGDSVFDAAMLVTAVDEDRAQLVLDNATQSTILAFYESGADALITDDRVEVQPNTSARVLTPQIRNAARMSRALSERAGEIGPA